MTATDMPSVLKVHLGDDVRRIHLACWSIDSVQSSVQTTFTHLTPNSLVLKYFDDEGDACVLVRETFADFMEQSHGKASAKVQVEILSSPDVLPPQQDVEMPNQEEGSQTGSGSPQMVSGCPSEHFRHLLPILAGFLPAPGAMNESFAQIVHQYGPMLAQFLESNHHKIDEFAAGHHEAILPVVEALRSGLEPFPQFHEAMKLLDDVVKSRPVNGLGKALQVLLAALLNSPADDLGDIISVVLGPVSEKLGQCLAPFGSSHAAVVHHGIVCDGCNTSPIVGPRYKCMQRPDYDLCQKCKDKQDPAEHSFRCIEVPEHPRSPWCGWGKGFGKGLWKGKGWGKGWNKGCPAFKGWCGKGHSARTSKDDDLSTSSGSISESDLSGLEGFEVEMGDASVDAKETLKETLKQEKFEFKRKKRAAKEEMKRACKEAKAKYKLQMQDAKQAFARVKKAEKTQKKMRKQEAKMSKQKERKASPSRPACKSYADASAGKSPLEVLAEMGFVNIELNCQLLEAKNNNVEEVLKVLLG